MLFTKLKKQFIFTMFTNNWLQSIFNLNHKYFKTNFYIFKPVLVFFRKQVEQLLDDCSAHTFDCARRSQSPFSVNAFNEGHSRRLSICKYVWHKSDHCSDFVKPSVGMPIGDASPHVLWLQTKRTQLARCLQDV